jgi:hypothetical protein
MSGIWGHNREDGNTATSEEMPAMAHQQQSSHSPVEPRAGIKVMAHLCFCPDA